MASDWLIFRFMFPLFLLWGASHLRNRTFKRKYRSHRTLPGKGTGSSDFNFIPQANLPDTDTATSHLGKKKKKQTLEKGGESDLQSYHMIQLNCVFFNNNKNRKTHKESKCGPYLGTKTNQQMILRKNRQNQTETLKHLSWECLQS